MYITNLSHQLSNFLKTPTETFNAPKQNFATFLVVQYFFGSSPYTATEGNAMKLALEQRLEGNSKCVNSYLVADFFP